MATKRIAKKVAQAEAKREAAAAALAKEAAVKAAPVKEVKTAEASVKDEVKTEAVEKTPVKETAAETVKEVVKETAVKEKAAKKPAAKRTALKEEILLQFAGKEVNTAEITKNVKDIWTKVMKNKVGDMKTVSIYLKPEDSAAYYVINGEVTGKIEL